MRRLLLVVVLMGLALPAWADHPATSDLGVDQAWVNDMNNESYWENLWDAGCTKFEGHNGFIPAQYDAAVVKSGSTQVRVYSDLSDVGGFTAIGPPNPNANHPNRRHTAPFSWVMKCEVNETTTTTTQPTDPTTSSTIPQETTTSLPDPTTTTPDSSTSVPTTSPSTTVPVETTTVPGLSEWTASADCDSITVSFSEGISQVDIHSLDRVPGTGEEVGDLDNPFTESGEQNLRVSSPTTFRLIPVVEPGYMAVPVSIDVIVPVCETSTTEAAAAPSTTAQATSTVETLPFTGPSDWMPLAFVATAFAGLGGLMVWSARKQES